MRSKSPVRDMFKKSGTYKIHDEEVPGGKFNLYMPKDKPFRTNHPCLDNLPEEEVPDQNELAMTQKQNSRSNSPNRPQRRQPREPKN